MAEYTGFEVNGYDGDVSSKFDSFEYSAPRNAHDSVFKRERTYRTVTDNDTDLISNTRMINDKMAVDNSDTLEPLHRTQSEWLEIDKNNIGHAQTRKCILDFRVFLRRQS